MAKRPLFTPVTFDVDAIPADDARAADLNRRYFAGRQASSAARVAAGKARAAIMLSAADYDRQRRQERVSGVVLVAKERRAKGDVKEDRLREYHPNDPDNPQRKVKRVCFSDGLDDANLPSDLKAAGEHYREAYEAVHASGRSNDIPRAGSGVQAARTTITDNLADAIQRLHRLDHVAGPQCLNIVRSVAGVGRSLRSIYPGSRSRKLAAARLRIGLGRIARWLAS